MAGERVHVSLLGDFGVEIDGASVGRDRWERPQARALVKLLALAPGHRLHREQVVDALWPDDPVEQAAPRLHKLAHYARRALGDPATVVLDADQVLLAPGMDLTVDVETFEAEANRAVDRHDAALAARAADRHGAGLLPDDRYEPWCADRRRHLERLHVAVLRVAGRWEEVLAVEPADEQAHLALMRRHESEGRRVLALRQYDRLERALRSTVGAAPGEEARRLRDRVLGSGAPARPRLVGRADERARLTRAAARAPGGAGRAVLVTGPEGIGKTALAGAVEVELAEQGWATASGAVAEVEVQPPGAPVLEALRRLADAHPEALARLGADARSDLTRAWSHRPLARPDEGAAARVALAAERFLAAVAAIRPTLVVVHRLDRAGHATHRLFHGMARAARRLPVLLVGTMLPARPGTAPGKLRASLLGLDAAEEVALADLDRGSASELLRRELDRPAAGALADAVARAVGGNPLLLTESARVVNRSGAPPEDAARVVAGAVEAGLDRLRPDLADTLRRASLLGDEVPFELLCATAAAGQDPDEVVGALAATGFGAPSHDAFRFRHPAVRAAVERTIPPGHLRRLHAELADQLAAAGAAPGRIAHHLVEAGAPGAAAAHQLDAATRAWESGAYEDALDLVEAARPHASGDVEVELVVLRAQLLDALGDPAVLAAYATAIAVGPAARRPLLRALQARTAMTMGDLDVAEASLEGLDADGGDADGMILLAQGMLTFFHGDLDGAEAHARAARRHALRSGAPGRLLDAITLDGLIAHTRGRWHERIREELAEAVRSPSTASVVFDSHLCVAEYMLYGASGDYDDVARFARSFRADAEQRGVRRAEAFATTLEGEARLLAGRLDAAADLLADAADIHRALRAPTGEAHCTQRLAEVRLALDDRAGARRLLDHALGLARWSPLARHLLPRIHGTMVRAAEDPAGAVAAVDRGIEAMGPADECMFCPVMFEVPAAAALADAGRTGAAADHLELARRYAARWCPSTWDAAVLEAEAHLRAARDETGEAERLLRDAAERFSAAGHGPDEQRCRRYREALTAGRLRVATARQQ